jgi:hypothetical protein
LFTWKKTGGIRGHFTKNKTPETHFKFKRKTRFTGGDPRPQANHVRIIENFYLYFA